jgi:hypothetical protein
MTVGASKPAIREAEALNYAAEKAVLATINEGIFA